MNTPRVSILIAVAVAIFLSACSRLTDIEVDRKIAELQQLVDRSLNVGDSPEQIVAFYKTNGLDYTFDRFQKRYQSSYPDTKTPRSFSKARIGIFIYVDDEGRFTKGEVTKHLPY